MSEAQYNNIANNGCAWCGNQVSFKEARQGAIKEWVARDMYVCKSCEHQAEANG